MCSKKCFDLFNLITAVIECICFSALVFGWPAFDYVFRKEGYFTQPCEEYSTILEGNSSNITSENQCVNQNTQDESLSLVFIITSSVMSATNVPMGLLFDRYGSWVSRSIASAFSNGAQRSDF